MAALPSLPVAFYGHTPHSLTSEQESIITRIVGGTSLYFAGEAGTGKSFLVRRIISRLRESHSRNEIYVTAPTGIAARKVGGITLHSFSGTGIHKLSFDKYVDKIKLDGRVFARWKSIKILIIDEGECLFSNQRKLVWWTQIIWPC
jgi:ATP-dependent DNA helicase PIF1